jgi:hypothetical protein
VLLLVSWIAGAAAICSASTVAPMLDTFSACGCCECNLCMYLVGSNLCLVLNAPNHSLCGFRCDIMTGCVIRAQQCLVSVGGNDLKPFLALHLPLLSRLYTCSGRGTIGESSKGYSTKHIVARQTNPCVLLCQFLCRRRWYGLDCSMRAPQRHALRSMMIVYSYRHVSQAEERLNPITCRLRVVALL